MQLEDYFDFQRPDDIRIKGSRIGIESVLYEYIHRKRTPEEIAESFRTISLEDVYATILYYLHNKEPVSAYIADWLEYCHQTREAAARNPSSATRRLLRVKAALDAAGLTVDDYLHDPAVRRRIDSEVAVELAQAA